MARKWLRIRIAWVGLWGSLEDATPLTHQDLKEIAETFSPESKVPITLGHRMADFMPAFGWVHSLTFDELTGGLYGDVELNDLLSEAYKHGLYRNWSMGIKRRAKDGKRYLHHLAFLGAVPPKIQGLKVLDSQVVFADEVDETWGRMDMSSFENTSSKEGSNMQNELERMKAELAAKEREFARLSAEKEAAEKKVEQFADLQQRIKDYEARIRDHETRLKEQQRKTLVDVATGCADRR